MPREVRKSVSSCGEDLEKVLGPGFTELEKIQMRDSFEKQYRMISRLWRMTVESETRAFT